jgi:hypothetical protein
MGPNGPYELITAQGDKPARIPSSAPEDNITFTGPLINANGLELSALVNATRINIGISGTNPMNYGQVAAQIGSQSAGLLRGYVTGNMLVVETTQVGGLVSFMIDNGDLAGATGLPLNEPSYGKQSHIPLIPDQIRYSFIDYFGSVAYYYKVRPRGYHNIVGSFSDSISPLTIPRAVETTLGYVQLVDGDGTALAFREVLVYSRFTGQLFNGRVVAGYNTQKLTNKEGKAEFVLVRGLPITVAIAGTNLVRDLVVPTDPAVTAFNLLDPTLGSNDVFKVQVPNIPYAVRRS